MIIHKDHKGGMDFKNRNEGRGLRRELLFLEQKRAEVLIAPQSFTIFNILPVRDELDNIEILKRCS